MVRAYKKKYHFIYKTTNLVNGKFYVGMHSTDDLNDGYIGSGKHLWNSVRKYGKENFKTEIVESFESRDELVKRERELVNEDLLNDSLCMNIRLGGEGGWDHVEWSEERKDRQREIIKRSHDTFRQRIEIDAEFKELISEQNSKTFKKLHAEGKMKYDNFAGKKHTDETLQKMRAAKVNQGVGETNSQFGTCWICNTELASNKKIPKDQLEEYLLQGWIKGRKYFAE